MREQPDGQANALEAPLDHVDDSARDAFGIDEPPPLVVGGITDVVGDGMGQESEGYASNRADQPAYR